MTEKEFLLALSDIADYWEKCPIATPETDNIHTRINGAIFSILVLIDGDSSLNDFRKLQVVSYISKTPITTGETELHDLWCKLTKI